MDYLVFNNPQFPFDQDELNYQVLLEVDDEALKQLCTVNPRISRLCNNDDFWRHKLEVIVQKTVPRATLPEGYTWHKIYNQMKNYTKQANDSVYLLVSPNEDETEYVPYIYDDVALAYNDLISDVATDTGYDKESLLTVDLNNIYIARIYRIFLVKVSKNTGLNVDYEMLFRIGPPYVGGDRLNKYIDRRNVINQLINFYPLLVTPDVMITYFYVRLHVDSLYDISKLVNIPSITVYVVNNRDRTYFEYHRGIGFVNIDKRLVLLANPILQTAQLVVLNETNPWLQVARTIRSQSDLMPSYRHLILQDSEVLPLSKLINYLLR